jgi:thiamine biosynthesis protein ThiS
MITVLLNDQVIRLESMMNLSELLMNYVDQTGGFAVALNCRFIPRIDYARTLLKDSDQVELIRPMQGG